MNLFASQSTVLGRHRPHSTREKARFSFFHDRQAEKAKAAAS